MNAAPEPTPSDATPAPVQHWRDRIAALKAEIAAKEAELGQLEEAAGRAALEGKPLPDTSRTEAELRALRRGHELAREALAKAEAEVVEAQRAVHAAAASQIAAERVKAAQEVDSLLVALQEALEAYERLGLRWVEQINLSGTRRRRAPETHRSRLSGAILHSAPILFEMLEIPRPLHAVRAPLAGQLAPALTSMKDTENEQ